MEQGNGLHWNIRDLLADLMGARDDQPEPREVIWASDPASLISTAGCR